MVNNYWDYGMQEDFDNMTKELGRVCLVYPRDDDLDSTGQEDTASGLGTGVSATVFLQELDSQHEMVESGQMNVGDVHLTLQHDTTAQEEGYISPDSGTTMYKILKLSTVKNQNNNIVIYTKGYAKKVPNR